MRMEYSKILIVDDSTYICKQVERIFQNQEEICLKYVHTGSDGLAAVSSFQPDLILLDVILPDAIGYELYQKIKEVDQNHAYIVFLTSKDNDEDIVKAFSLGANDYIQKPFHNSVFLSRIQVHLKNKKASDQLRKMNEDLESNMQRLNSMAYRDSLTGLFNRRYVEEQMQAKIKQSDRVAMLMCDVDDFKHVNDYYGHEIGDIVLIGIASIMESAGNQICVTRWGGEEFLILIFHKTKEEVFEISETIRRKVESFAFSSAQTPFHCTISIGLVMYDQKQRFDENLRHADDALYKGKRSGKNCSIWYDGIYQ